MKSEEGKRVLNDFAGIIADWAFEHHIQTMARRLGIDHPLSRMPERFARDRVRAVWIEDPTTTRAQLVATMGTPHPLHITRAYAYLKACRWDAAGRSPVHTRVG